MNNEYRAFPTAFWQAINHVLQHYYVDERSDYRSLPPHQRSPNHVYHSLRMIRRQLRRTHRPLDIPAFLESRRRVAVVWSTEDVLGVRPHLTEDQAWDVLGRCERIHDCNYGFTWELLESVADDLYPAPAGGSQEDAK